MPGAKDGDGRRLQIRSMKGNDMIQITQITRKIGPLDKGDIRLNRRERGVVAFEAGGVLIGEVFAHGHYRHEFISVANPVCDILGFRTSTVGEMQARLDEAVNQVRHPSGLK